MIYDWTVPFTLVTPYGTILLNSPSNPEGFFALDPEECEIGPSVRAQADDIPQGDGAILHDRYFTGVSAKLVVQLWETTGKIACDAQLQTMGDILQGAVRSLKDAGDNEGRLRWIPTGLSERMLDDIRLLEYPKPNLGDAGVSVVEFTVDTAYPYAINLTELQTTVNSTTGDVTNLGNADYWPTIKVHGPAANFFIRNNNVLDDNGDALSIEYDSALPGGVPIPGGSYAEIDMFRGTIYLDGDGANLKGGVDVGMSDLWPLVPGANSITTDAEAEFLVNAAWG